MTDVFLSYANEDRERAATLARSLEAAGWSVWWDRKIVAGHAFDEAIERELETAKSVVVLWSRSSVTSEWVKNEAAAAAERDVLVPASIERVRLPLEFRRKQTVDLADWTGDTPHEGFQALCAGIADRVGRTSAPSSRQVPTVRTPRQMSRRGLLLGGVLAVVVLGLGAALLPSTAGARVDARLGRRPSRARRSRERRLPGRGHVRRQGQQQIGRDGHGQSR